jgi:hypothetical protein
MQRWEYSGQNFDVQLKSKFFNFEYLEAVKRAFLGAEHFPVAANLVSLYSAKY